ncbi:hypothetical protein H072_9225 [Dactylellina haptotyla CBS 200.50]|uniref:RlpA-like protein double-psi beta-barrel domain-containing protein n=1 Tax=Dactylellina haptotyla (strain CBS 200.50) TaxID=1284197 RepID=S8A332_DACHA|nr:hypothetical protein H072_9225 [Dactylellina haptotyla CBS 200.50]
MQFGYKFILALMALVEVASSSNPVNMLQKRDAVVIVKQEILEIVGYTSTVWVQPPPPSEVPTPTSAPALVSEPTETPAPVVEPVVSPSPEPVQDGSGGYGGGYSGKATFYDAGLGSCGETHTNSDMICALSKVTMSLTAGANPNLNPKCGTKIRVKSASNPTGVIVTIVDTCPGCAGPYDLDLSPAAFDQLGNQFDGVISVTWEDV